MASGRRGIPVLDHYNKLVGPDPYDKAPAFTPEQIAWLKETYPPRCMMPMETIQNHLHYSGKVDLVESLARMSSSRQLRGNKADRVIVDEIEGTDEDEGDMSWHDGRGPG